MISKMFSHRVFVSKSASRRFVAIKRNFCISPMTNVVSSTSKQNNNELTKIVVDPQTKIATLFLNRLPANALTTDLMTKIKDSVEELERQNVLGIIFTSTSDRIFSAGLDLNETYQRNPDHLAELWKSLQNMWKALFSTKLPTAALINGHALAGGCVIALCCDFRVILPKLTIGLNETQVGIAVPNWVMDSYLNIINSRRIAEADLIQGKCYKSDGALKVGLVDAVVDTREEALQKCIKFLQTYEGAARKEKSQMKLYFRSDIIHEFERNREKDLNIFLSGIQRAEVQELLGNYLRELKEKRVRK